MTRSGREAVYQIGVWAITVTIELVVRGWQPTGVGAGGEASASHYLQMQQGDGEQRRTSLGEASSGLNPPGCEMALLTDHSSPPFCPTNWSDFSRKRTLKLVRLP
jgi:hypothetical protein